MGATLYGRTKAEGPAGFLQKGLGRGGRWRTLILLRRGVGQRVEVIQRAVIRQRALDRDRHES